MSILKKILIFIMIPIILIGVLKNNVFANSNFSKETPVKIGVFLDNSNAMYVSLLKQNLERIKKKIKIKLNLHSLMQKIIKVYKMKV